MVQAEYTRFLKPLTGKLLGFLKLDKVYVDGRGNWLLYRDEQGITHRVLDLTGGYGANLLGHKHPEIIGAIPRLLAELPPSHVQGSIGTWSTLLARELSDRLSAETGVGPWVCTLANSGAEAVEAALKHALLVHRGSVKRKSFTLNTHFNSLRKHLEHLGPTEKVPLLDQIRRICRGRNLPEGLTDSLERVADLDGAIDLLEQQSRDTLLAPPAFLAVEGGFHGKTLGALSVTSNPLFREDFFLDDRNSRTVFIKRNDRQDIGRALDSIRTVVFTPELRNGTVSFHVKEIDRVAACILEPIQGEGGIHPLREEFVRSLREEADRRGFLLIFDEIQAGLYRTGMLSSGAHLGVCADLYCFSKALGGGVAKVAAMLTRKDRYNERFGFLHTSTFAEDSFSSAVACRVLQLLGRGAVEEGMAVAELLKRELEDLQARYPSVIKEIRGRGFLLGVEFHSSIRQSCYEFKLFCDLGMIGYFFSSSLLHHERLRVNPTLSSPYTLRLETSLFTTPEEVRQICTGLDRLCGAISRLDMDYFFGHIFPGCRIGPAHRIPAGVIRYEKGPRPSAVFLSHVIQTEDIKKIFHALKNVPSEVLEQQLRDLFDLFEFQVYYHGRLRGNNGREVDAVILALPAPSGLLRELYKSERSYLLCDKIQRALEHAKELGARTVGLGQFTSIVTRNGLCLDSGGLNLTTGNAYTVSLMIEATLRLAEERKIDMKEARIGFVGAAGNIVSVAASILADHCGKVSFFYHTPVERSKKLVLVLLGFLQEMASAPPGVYCAGRISRAIGGRNPKGREDLLAFLGRPAVKEVLAVETDLARLRHCDIVLTGTNAARPSIEPEFLKGGAVVVDAGVPGDVPVRLRELRPDVMVIKGGIARIPKADGRQQTIFLPSFPLKEGQAFGCMSETFSIGLSNGCRIYHVGPLHREVVEKARSIAQSAGFELCEYKEVKTFDF
jgi:acetylornithine/succinyldiaminopimelate/putrescine aminotransferase/predicted amino acid dehydrogenase